MIMTHRTLIVRTNTFGHYWTWIKRSILLGIILFVLLLVYVDGDHVLLGYVLAIVSCFVIFSIPKDDVALDRKYFYHVKKSLVPFFTTSSRVEIEKIKSIKCQGTYSKEYDLLAFLSFGQLYQAVNSVDITFKDNSSHSFNVGIYRDDLDHVIYKVRELI